MAGLARSYLLVALAVVLGCSTGDNAAGERAPEPPAAPAASAPAQVAPTATPQPAPAVTAQPAPAQPPSIDAGLSNDAAAPVLPGAPQGDVPLDGSDTSHRPSRSTAKGRARPSIHIVLKSTPSGAIAAVDGVIVGPTPAFWEGELASNPREFTFVLPGYAMARYRFVPTTNGVVHGQLERLKIEPPPNAGVTATVPPKP